MKASVTPSSMHNPKKEEEDLNDSPSKIIFIYFGFIFSFLLFFFFSIGFKVL